MNELHYKPLRNLLLIKIDPNSGEKKSASGILYQEAWERPSNIAEVLEVGPLVTTVQKGATVVINPYALIDLHTSGGASEELKRLKIIKETDIICSTE